MLYAVGRAAKLTPVVALLDLVNDWSRHRMTALNRAILERRCPPDTLRLDFSRHVLALLPPLDGLSPRQARQLVVLLGLAGASIGRHHQESAPENRTAPELAFAGLTVGAGSETFLRYFGRIADRTGTGHGNRDSYASLVRWNLPPAEVHWGGQRVATLPGCFDDGLVRTYTGTADETRFFGLLKASEALEKAVNQQLIPLSEGSVDLADDEALRRIARAVLLLDALRDLNTHFAVLPPSQGMSVGYFLDVFRQYAIHWRSEDIPPSGAQDVEALARDLLVGIAIPGYPEHLRKLFPSLLSDERERLEALLNRPSVPELALRRAGLDATQLAFCSASELRHLVAGHPVLAALFLLLNAHARVAGVHLMLSKRFLFGPQRARDREGKGDSGVVSNRSGTTGMDESRLERLTRARHDHALSSFRNIPAHPLEALGRPKRIAIELPPSDAVVVRFTGTALAPTDLGLPAVAEIRSFHHRARS